MEIDEEKLRLMVNEASRSAVKAELDERQHIAPMEHYLHHQWAKDQMKKGRTLKAVVTETAAKWGTLAAIGALVYGIVEILKSKVGF